MENNITDTIPTYVPNKYTEIIIRRLGLGLGLGFNAAERAIRTFKNHFIAGLASIDNQYPIREWDRLLP